MDENGVDKLGNKHLHSKTKENVVDNGEEKKKVQNSHLHCAKVQQIFWSKNQVTFHFVWSWSLDFFLLKQVFERH